VIFSNPDSVFGSETGLTLEYKAEKMHSSDWAKCQEAIDGITNKLKS
jgi:hypothetical protein